MQPVPRTIDLPASAVSSARRGVRAAVYEESEILRRGLLASLAEDPAIEAVVPDPGAPGHPELDVAVVSSQSAGRRFSCPIVIYGDGASRHEASPGNQVVGVLDRRTLTGDQLRATVHAVAAGLRVGAEARREPKSELDPRSRQILEMLAEGFTTREMAEHMNYSERTIKKLITVLQGDFGARSRAQIVAHAIRRGLI